MKELWSVLIEKLKQVEPTIAAVIIGICGIFTIAMATIVTTGLFKMIIKIVEITNQSGSQKGF